MTDGVQMDAARRAAMRQRCEQLKSDHALTGQNSVRWFDQHLTQAGLLYEHDVPDLLAALDQAERENARLRGYLVESAAQLLFERRVRKEEHKPDGQRQQYWSDLREDRRDYWRAEAKRQIAAPGEEATRDGD